MRQAIDEAGGVEVFAISGMNEAGMVYDLEIHCRGNEGATPALLSRYNLKSLYITTQVVFYELRKQTCT